MKLLVKLMLSGLLVLSCSVSALAYTMADNTFLNVASKTDQYTILEWRGNVKVDGKLLVGRVKNRLTPDVKVPVAGARPILVTAVFSFEKTSDYVIVRDKEKAMRTITPTKFSYEKANEKSCTTPDCRPVVSVSRLVSGTHNEFYDLLVAPYLKDAKAETLNVTPQTTKSKQTQKQNTIPASQRLKTTPNTQTIPNQTNMKQIDKARAGGG